MRRIVAGWMLVAACAAGCGDSDSEGGTSDAAVSDAGSDASTGASAGDAGTDAGSGDASTAGDAGTDAGSAGDGGASKQASVTLAAKSESTTTGSATFKRGSDGKVSVTLTVSGASDGSHGVHIHVTGDCSAADATSAGGHWNPDMHMHGDLTDPSTTHLGDLGNIVVANGTGTLTKENSEWTLGDQAMTDVVGHALVVHANADDFTQGVDGGAPGNSGKRIACGVITAN